MKLTQVLQRYTEYPNRKIKLRQENVEVIYNELKSLAFNYDTYKWSKLKECKRFLDENNIHPKLFIKFCNYIIHEYYKNSNSSKGEKSALEFILRLKRSSYFNRGTKKKISLQPQVEILDFLDQMSQLKLKLQMTHDEMVDFIFQNFKIGYSKSTLRRHYMDNNKKKQNFSN